jgi:hypothetical protein
MDPLIKVYNLSIFCYNWELAQADFKLFNKKYKHFVLVTAGFESGLDHITIGNLPRQILNWPRPDLNSVTFNAGF